MPGDDFLDQLTAGTHLAGNVTSALSIHLRTPQNALPFTRNPAAVL